MINKVYKVIDAEGSYCLIIQTEGDDDFWWWEFNKGYVDEYFSEKGIEFDIAKAEVFANDLDNNLIGCSTASFSSVEEAEEDYRREIQI